MKTATVSVSDKIRRIDYENPGLAAGVIAKRLGCTVNLVYQVRAVEAKKKAATKAQITKAVREQVTTQSLAICDVPKGSNGVAVNGVDPHTLPPANWNIVVNPNNTVTAICDAADIVLSAKQLAARCGGVNGLRQLLDAITAK